MSTPKRRVLETISKIKQPTGEMKELAVEYYTENAKSNEHKKLAGAARKTLFGQMVDADIRSFRTTMKSGRGSVDLNVEVGEARATTKVDMQRLRKLIGDDEKLL